jgi:hypothetical protein
MRAGDIIVRLMREVENLRAENAWLWTALRGYQYEPESPFPGLGGEEIIGILHPADRRRRACRTQ